MATYQQNPHLPDRPGHIPAKSGTKTRSDRPQARPEGDEESLAAILTLDERSHLIDLIDTATAYMRKAVVQTFDSHNKSPDILIDFEETTNTSLELKGGSETVDVSLDCKQREHVTERERELSTPEMRALKRSALRWFDKWRGNVLRRVAEAASTRQEPKGQSGGSYIAGNQRHEASQGEVSWDDESWNKIPGHLVESLSITDQTETLALHDLYPPIQTPLVAFDKEKRTLVLHSVLLLLLSLEHYHAPSRILLLNLASSLNLPLATLDKDEETTAGSLLSAAKALSAASETQKKADENQSSRTWKVFGASIAGAAVIGLTGGLAAPLVAASIGSVLGGLGLGATAAAGLLGSVAGSSVLVGGLFGAYGGRMTGQIMEQYAREVSDFAFLPVRGGARSRNPPPRQRGNPNEDAAIANPADRRLRVTIGISGWLDEKQDVINPWRVLGTSSEVFALRWELEALMNLGTGMSAIVTSTAWSYAKVEVFQRTVFASLLGAVMWPVGLLQIASLVDNPFSVARTRADKAGEVLADALINRAQGERPVALLGYSLGARVIYSCLVSLAKRKAFDLISNVILLGAPVPNSSFVWRLMRSVVAGRIINVFSEHDYVLGFLYRTSSAQYGIAGLQKVEGVKGVENVDVSEIVSGHLRYRYLLGRILKDVGWEDLNMKELERESEALRVLEREEVKEEETRTEQRRRKSAVGEMKEHQSKLMPVSKMSVKTTELEDERGSKPKSPLSCERPPTSKVVRIGSSPPGQRSFINDTSTPEAQTVLNDQIAQQHHSFPLTSSEPKMAPEVNIPPERPTIPQNMSGSEYPRLSAQTHSSAHPSSQFTPSNDADDADDDDEESTFRKIVMVDNDNN
ncbi:hypothetical protein MMC24_000666 [Lignoscripta atroalba]|nr:hypothetical protein [Lignoscripta atroalba]